MITIPVASIPIRTPVVEKTDAMYNVTDYLIRVAPTSKLDFNYQPLANQIVTKWVTVEYPANYYKNGGTNTGYMRDEVYPFFIRYIYNTGDKSASYHIPGRPPLAAEANGIFTFAPLPVVADALADEVAAGDAYNWAVNNLAQGTLSSGTLPDGGVITAEGIMGYWESTEYYPNDKPEIWNASAHPWSTVTTIPYSGSLNGLADYDICGKPIRHHRFPDNYIQSVYSAANHFKAGGDAIRIMGVKFENIRPPVDNQGVPIPGIVGYEILRGSRGGNKTVIAKGVINNMRQYDFDMDGDNNTSTGQIGAYQNYPYNDLRSDPFLSNTQSSWGVSSIFGGSGTGEHYTPNSASYTLKHLFTFHSPDTTFVKPFLSGRELKVYEEYNGTVKGKYEYSEQHPKSKIVTNLAFFLSAIAGLGLAGIAQSGRRTIKRSMPRINSDPWNVISGTGGTGVAGTAGVPIAPATTQQLAAIVQLAAAQGLDNSAAAYAVAILGIQSSGNYQYKPAFPPIPLVPGYDTKANIISTLSSLEGGTKNIDYEDSAYSQLPRAIRVLNAVQTFSGHVFQGTDDTLELIRAALPYRDYALKYNSHGFYDNYLQAPAVGSRRTSISEQSYIG
ncbi:MAG: hypothetical protein WCI37_03300, partial [bacterium]